jgi:intracellular septation protein
MMTEMPAAGRKAENPWLKLALELGPLLVFFFANGRFGIFVATGAFMAAMAVALIASWVINRRLAIMPLVTGVVVAIFGTLTLILHDDTFIKMKPTIVNTLFGVVLLGGLAFGTSLLGYVFNAAFQLDAEGWKKLTLRWGVFFLFLAVLNEVVWRNFSDDVWVSFKVWGTMPITILFTLAQMPLIMKHSLEDKEEK